MEEAKGKPLDELIESARTARLVDDVQKRGRNVSISVGGERFTLSREKAEEFLASLLRFGRG